MRKTDLRAVRWYEPEDNRGKPTATLDDGGCLRFGAHMQHELTGGIKVGLLEEENAIVIQKCAEQGKALPSTGRIRVSKIAKRFHAAGLCLPLCFYFEEETRGFWVGHIVPLLRRGRAAKPKTLSFRAEHAWLADAYRWMIDKAVATCAKSTPMDERRAMAREALLEAIGGYSPVYGTLKEQLWEKIILRLTEHNRQ